MATILEFGARLTRSSFTEKTEVLSDSYPDRNATDSRDDGSQSKFFICGRVLLQKIMT